MAGISQLRNDFILLVCCSFLPCVIFIVSIGLTGSLIPRIYSVVWVISRASSQGGLSLSKEILRSDIQGLLNTSNGTDGLGDFIPSNLTGKFKDIEEYDVDKVCGNWTSLKSRGEMKPLQPQRRGSIDSKPVARKVAPLREVPLKDQIEKWKPVVDPHDYRYIHNPEDACVGSDPRNPPENITLLILVTTALTHFAQRDIIRRSWMRATDFYCLSAKTLFLLGTTNDFYLQAFISHEANFHGDIIQEDFIDSYLNLSIKSVMGLKWATTFCPNAAFVMKTDDDVMLNIYNLTTDLSNAPPSARRDFVVARRLDSHHPLRNTRLKWYTPGALFAGATYPPYPEGHGYIMSADIVQKLYEVVTTNITLFLWEDVFIGMAMQELGISIIDLPCFFLNRCLLGYTKNELRMNNASLLAVQHGYFSYDLSPREMEDVWSAILWGRWPYAEESTNWCEIDDILKYERLPDLWTKLNK